MVDSSDGAAANGTLTEALKARIQSAYRAWLGNRGFKPRRGQRQMIADIARALTNRGNRLCVVEAGTGTGKTAAYCLAAIPVAQALDKRVVISTATVALQEQVVLRDLPDLQRHADLDFSFALAKGRSRYVCLQRLEDRLRADPGQEAQLFEPPGMEELATYRRLQTDFANGSWDGELDTWRDGIERAVWRPVTNDRVGCAGGRCSYYHQCPFFKARRSVAEADVVVANHDLVLADLSLGGGVVLPPPAETIFVLDEAHHLAEKTRDHFTVNVRLRAAAEWQRQVASGLETMRRQFGDPQQVQRAQKRMEDAGELRDLLGDVEALARQLPFERRDERNWIRRFPLGEVPAEIRELAPPLSSGFATAAATLEELCEALEQVLAGDLEWDNRDRAESWLPVVGQLAGQARAAEQLFSDYAVAPEAAARWATLRRFDSGDDIELTSAPLDIGRILGGTLWEMCHAAVATSATLCALGTFERFRDVCGLPGETATSRIQSPFDFHRIAAFSVPVMQSDPRDAAAHTEEVAALLPELLAMERSALVLFTSWRQFNEVADSLSDDLRDLCRLQDSASKRQLLFEHRQAIDEGERSYLFGLASFAEGVDLPGDYCRHVILAKLPFVAPDDPVDEAVAEALENEGRNPFMEVSVPEASLRLVQACGRLIRHETDGGRITLLDRRIVTRRYGEALLASLPPYRLELG